MNNQFGFIVFHRLIVAQIMIVKISEDRFIKQKNIYSLVLDFKNVGPRQFLNYYMMYSLNRKS